MASQGEVAGGYFLENLYILTSLDVFYMKMTILYIGNSTLIPYLSPDNFGGRYLGFGVLCGEKYKWVVLQENLIIYSMQKHCKNTQNFLPPPPQKTPIPD